MQDFRIDGFDEVEVDACFVRALVIGLQPVPGYGNNERSLVVLLLPQMLGNLPAVHSWQTKVKQHHVGMPSLYGLQSARAIRGKVNFVAIQGKQHGHALSCIRVVFNDQDPQYGVLFSERHVAELVTVHPRYLIVKGGSVSSLRNLMAKRKGNTNAAAAIRRESPV
jgi:hypothetical protein